MSGQVSSNGWVTVEGFDTTPGDGGGLPGSANMVVYNGQAGDITIFEIDNVENIVWKYLYAYNAGTGAGAWGWIVGYTGTVTNNHFIQCQATSCQHGFILYGNSQYCSLVYCCSTSNANYGFNVRGNYQEMIGCSCHDNGDIGIKMDGDVVYLDDCLIYDNGNDGIYANTVQLIIKNTTIDGNTGHGG